MIVLDVPKVAKLGRGSAGWWSSLGHETHITNTNRNANLPISKSFDAKLNLLIILTVLIIQNKLPLLHSAIQ